MRGLFITATDTGVGKTEITAAIARQWRRQGRSFAVCKPVATGATVQEGRLVADDTLRLAAAALDPDLDAITPLVFSEPAAPPVAAGHAGRALTLVELAAAVSRRAGGVEGVLVEGVGGLLCPLTDTETVADLIEQLKLGVIVVARRGLGTLNHTLLTLEVAQRRGLCVRGVIVNELEPVQSLAEQTNVGELTRRLTVPLLAVVPYRQGGYEGPIHAIEAVDWWSLIDGGIQQNGGSEPGRPGETAIHPDAEGRCRRSTSGVDIAIT